MELLIYGLCIVFSFGLAYIVHKLWSEHKQDRVEKERNKDFDFSQTDKIFEDML